MKRTWATRLLVTALTATAFLAVPAPAAAYVGPGAALAVIGAGLAMIGAVFVTVGGFVWYPVKRLLRALRRGKNGDEEPAE